MKTMAVEVYQCEICGTKYDTRAEAAQCEKRKKSQDFGLKKGDKIMITSGDGAGQTATVERTFVYDKSWGHYAWETYWHTVGVIAKLPGGGMRQLTFDSYKPTKK